MGGLRWSRQEKARVEAALRAGCRPDMATTTAVGPLDGLVALHDGLGGFAALDGFSGARQRAGVDDVLLPRTAAVLPFVGNTGCRSLAARRFREPAILLRLGWSPVQLREGSNGRYRHAAGRQPESLPRHPDTLRDALARIADNAWLAAPPRAVQGRYQRGLLRGGPCAVEGTALGATRRVVALVCVSATHPVVVAWRYLEGTASEQGKEAAVTRALVEQALAAGGPGCLRLLLADGLYAEGPPLAWVK